MTKVLIATEKPFAKAAVDQIKATLDQAAFESTFFEKYTTKEELLEAVADADAMIVRSDKITPDVIEAAKNLKIVVRAGAGFDNVNLDAANANNVCVMNTPGQNSNAVAELALGMMVFQARNQFTGGSGSELKGKKLGIHAYGNVGRLVANIAKGFGMEIYAFDPYVSKESMEAEGVVVCDTAEQLYSACDYISLHIPANAQTKKSINYELLSNMKDGSVIVNTARKEVIDEEGLVKLMEEKPKFQYLSDIAPDNKDILKEKFEGRVFFTPKKMGAQTAEANINAGIAAAKQIIGYINNGDTTFKVN
jgi:D-3-phosphoglycerate dehydrogenase